MKTFEQWWALGLNGAGTSLGRRLAHAAWDAARADALEEVLAERERCAKICDAARDDYPEGDAAWVVARTCAEMIRALARPQTEKPECSICRSRHGSEVRHACE